MAAARHLRELLPYQARWINDDVPLKVWEKSRRIGASWAEAADAVIYAARRGGGSHYYMSYSKEMARGFVDDCAQWAKVLQAGASAVQEEILDLDDRGSIQVLRIKLASGQSIVALPSSPRALRSLGRPGDRVTVDEAAFLDDLPAVLKAALAFLLWSGRVHVISTHNGEGSAFNALLTEVRDGRKPGSVHRTTLGEAIDDGLYGRICAVSGMAATEAGAAAWEADVRRMYGESAAEELDCVPSSGAGSWLSWEQVLRAEDDDAGRPEMYRGGAVWIGVDIARRRDLWVATAIEQVGDVLWLREMAVREDTPFRVHKAVVGEMIRRYRPVRVAVDQTGMGEAVVEDWRDTWGWSIEGVSFSEAARLDLATHLRAACEDGRLRIPRADALRDDLRSVKRAAGATGARVRLVTDSRGTDGHADRFWSLALAVAASAAPRAHTRFRVAGAADSLVLERGRDARPRHGRDEPTGIASSGYS